MEHIYIEAQVVPASKPLVTFLCSSVLEALETREKSYVNIPLEADEFTTRIARTTTRDVSILLSIV